MTAFLNDVDFDNAKAILSGYCWTESVQRIYRIIYFANNNPNLPKPIMKRANIKGITPAPDPFSLGLPSAEPIYNPAIPYIDSDWNQLSDILKRQVSMSFFVQCRQTNVIVKARIYHHRSI